MNTLYDLPTAKIAEPVSDNKGKKFLSDIGFAKRRQDAIEREGEFSLFYQNTLDDNHILGTREAQEIGKSGSTVHLYQSVGSERNFPAALLPMSLVGKPLLENLAGEMGGTVLWHEGIEHIHKRNAISSSLLHLSIISEDCDKGAEAKQWKEILKVAEQRLEELK